MDFLTDLLVSTNWKSKTYNSILVIVDRLTKMIYYKPVKVITDTSGLAKVIINVIVRHHGIADSIISNYGSVFTSKFWSLSCYFPKIKNRLLMTFYLQINGRIENQNSTIDVKKII